MNEQASITKDLLHDWVEEQTRQLDVVASWESLCDTYMALQFSDPLSDTVRLEEFKWIIKEMNKFLTRMRSKLMSCRDPNSMVETLRDSFTPSGHVAIENRKALAYQKLRQRWVLQMIAQLEQVTMMNEEEDHGYAEPGDAGE